MEYELGGSGGRWGGLQNRSPPFLTSRSRFFPQELFDFEPRTIFRVPSLNQIRKHASVGHCAAISIQASCHPWAYCGVRGHQRAFSHKEVKPDVKCTSLCICLPCRIPFQVFSYSPAVLAKVRQMAPKHIHDLPFPDPIVRWFTTAFSIFPKRTPHVSEMMRAVYLNVAAQMSTKNTSKGRGLHCSTFFFCAPGQS